MVRRQPLGFDYHWGFMLYIIDTNINCHLLANNHLLAKQVNEQVTIGLRAPTRLKTSLKRSKRDNPSILTLCPMFHV